MLPPKPAPDTEQIVRANGSIQTFARRGGYMCACGRRVDLMLDEKERLVTLHPVPPCRSFVERLET